MNNTLRNTAVNILKELLAQCDEKQQFKFKRMYSFKNLDLPIDEVVDNMDDDKMDLAISQCERTITNNKEAKEKEESEP